MAASSATNVATTSSFNSTFSTTIISPPHIVSHHNDNNNHNHHHHNHIEPYLQGTQRARGRKFTTQGNTNFKSYAFSQSQKLKTSSLDHKSVKHKSLLSNNHHTLSAELREVEKIEPIPHNFPHKPNELLKNIDQNRPQTVPISSNISISKSPSLSYTLHPVLSVPTEASRQFHHRFSNLSHEYQAWKKKFLHNNIRPRTVQDSQSISRYLEETNEDDITSVSKALNYLTETAGDLNHSTWFKNTNIRGPTVTRQQMNDMLKESPLNLSEKQNSLLLYTLFGTSNRLPYDYLMPKLLQPKASFKSETELYNSLNEKVNKSFDNLALPGNYLTAESALQLFRTNVYQHGVRGFMQSLGFGSGPVSYDKFAQAVRDQHLKLKPEEMKRLCELVDTNKDNLIDTGEFWAMNDIEIASESKHRENYQQMLDTKYTKEEQDEAKQYITTEAIPQAFQSAYRARNQAIQLNNSNYNQNNNYNNTSNNTHCLPYHYARESRFRHLESQIGLNNSTNNNNPSSLDRFESRASAIAKLQQSDKDKTKAHLEWKRNQLAVAQRVLNSCESDHIHKVQQEQNGLRARLALKAQYMNGLNQQKILSRPD